MFFPKSYFITGGVGVSDISVINAFDKAVIDAGVGDYNLVQVSSIIPRNAIEINPIKLETGTVVPIVISKKTGITGEQICSGIGWGQTKDKNLGLVMEHHDLGVNREEIEKKLFDMLREGSAIRNIKLECMKTHIEILEVPNKSYGCVVSCLVLVG